LNFQNIADEALNLPKEQRASLIQKLLLSLDTPPRGELREDWLCEAGHRAEELDQGSVQTISSDEVLKKARALLK
jgi:hypothetical protein